MKAGDFKKLCYRRLSHGTKTAMIPRQIASGGHVTEAFAGHRLSGGGRK